MDTTPAPKGTTSDHLANERTFLAWIRTSLGLMAFGFVVVKFALFLRQFSFVLQGTAAPPQGHSFVIGIFLVGFGVVIGVLSFLKYLHTKKQLDGARFTNTSWLAAVLTVAVLAIGTMLVLYLISRTR